MLQKLQPLLDSGGVSSIARATRPSVEMASVTSPREEEEYQKVREREEQLDDQWLTSMMVNQPPESRGPIRGMQVWVKMQYMTPWRCVFVVISF